MGGLTDGAEVAAANAQFAEDGADGAWGQVF